jgi:hypothetical protein
MPELLRGRSRLRDVHFHGLRSSVWRDAPVDRVKSHVLDADQMFCPPAERARHYGIRAGLGANIARRSSKAFEPLSADILAAA